MQNQISYREILDIIYFYYPKNLYDSDPTYRNTIQFQRLAKKCKEAQFSNINAFLNSLKEKFPLQEIEDWSPLYDLDPCYRFKIDLSANAEMSTSLIALVSVIAPVGSIYISKTRFINNGFSLPEILFTPEEESEKQLLAHAFESIAEVFDYNLLPIHLGPRIIPDVAVKNHAIGSTSVFHCLFTDHMI